MRSKLIDTRRPILEGQLSEVRALADLTLESPIERRATVIFDLEETTLSFEGKELRFPAHIEQELRFVVEAVEPFRPADIPGELDEPGRLVLVRRLVREGFLRVTDPRARAGSSPRSAADGAGPRRRT
jgi:hypothetical protein